MKKTYTEDNHQILMQHMTTSVDDNSVMVESETNTLQYMNTSLINTI